MNKVSSVNAGIATRNKRYHCGTLTYTKAGLVALFVGRFLFYADGDGGYQA